MSSDYDATEFVDGNLHGPKSPYSAAVTAPTLRAPTREEVDSKVAEAQQKLADLKRAQEQLERERSALEETRRRQTEFQTGRQEMVQNLTRGLGLLTEAEFTARRDAEQMAKALVELRDALAKIESIHDESWTQENFQLELTRALTILENARMEWNGARLKFGVLAEGAPDRSANANPSRGAVPPLLTAYSYGELCRLGFALTWPIALICLVLVLVLVFRR